jgi:hypothetical protein
MRRSAEVQWVKITTEPGLALWERAWRMANPDPDRSRLFKPGLLSRADIHFISAILDGAQVGGGVLNAGAGAVGLSNLFADGIDKEKAWRGLANEARAAFPDLSLVAYDRGDWLAAAWRVGFMTVGRLRVWRRAGAKPERRQVSRDSSMTDSTRRRSFAALGTRRRA